MGDLRNVIWRYAGLMGNAELNIIENLLQSIGKKEKIVAGKTTNCIFCNSSKEKWMSENFPNTPTII